MSNRTNEELLEEFKNNYNFSSHDEDLILADAFISACELKDTEITLLKEEFEKIRKELEWAVDTAYYWVDNKGDMQKCVDLEYKYKLKIDKDDKW